MATNIRQIKPYKRKVDGKIRQVEGYMQGYNKPRGPVRKFYPDSLNQKSQTMWLKDREGHFVGRANYKGDTRAIGVYRWGYDTTTMKRDKKHYKRVFGRMNQRKVRRYYK